MSDECSPECSLPTGHREFPPRGYSWGFQGVFREHSYSDWHEETWSVAVANQQVGNQERMLCSVRMMRESVVNGSLSWGKPRIPAVLSGVNRVGIGSLLVMVSLLYLQSANQNQRQYKSWNLYCTDLTQSKTRSCTPLRSCSSLVAESPTMQPVSPHKYCHRHESAVTLFAMCPRPHASSSIAAFPSCTRHSIFDSTVLPGLGKRLWRQ